MKYIIWKCNDGGIWTFTKANETPLNASNRGLDNTPIRNYTFIAEFESDEENALETWKDNLPQYLPKYVPPTAEKCLEIIKNKGIDHTRPFYATGVASQEELAVSFACQQLFAYRKYREAVEDIFSWPYHSHAKSVAKFVLRRWPKNG